MSALQNEIHETTRTKGEQIYQHESTIRALEARLNSYLGAYSADDIRTRDEEIAQLRESNDAAQDWMSKAANDWSKPQMRKTKRSKKSQRCGSLVVVHLRFDAATLRSDAVQPNLLWKIWSSMNQPQLKPQAKEGRRMSRQAQISHLREEMDSQEREAANCIALWQESYSAVEARCSELQRSLDEADSKSAVGSGVAPNPRAGEGLQHRISELQQLMDEKD